MRTHANLASGLYLLSLLLSGVAIDRSAAQTGPSPAKLFQSAGATISSLAVTDQHAGRRGTQLVGYVRLNASALQPSTGPVVASPFAASRDVLLNLQETVNLNLPIPGGGDMVVRLENANVPGLQQTNWEGQIAGVEDSSVTFSYANGIVAGTIRIPNTTLKIRRAQDDLYAIEKINPRDFPNEAHPVPRSDAQPPTDRDSAQDVADDIKKCVADTASKTLTLLVAYTEAAQKAAGGAAELTVLIGDIIGEANLALKNSKIRAHLAVASVDKVTVATDADSGKYLDNLLASDAVKKLRETHKADIVSLLDDLPSSYTYCGVGFVMKDAKKPSKSVGHNIVDLGCAANNFSLIHEVGHNLGAGHNAENAGTGHLFAYSFGLRWPNKFRTIMAYTCADTTPCDRIPRFTNPTIVFSGVTIGDAASADNARTLNETRCFAADWN